MAALALCTTLGPLTATVADGRLTGALGSARVEGTEAHLRVTSGGVVIWDGPLAGLEPTPPVAAASPAAGRAAEVGALGCEPRRVRVGAWPEPVEVPEGSWVVRRGPSDVLIRGPTGARHLVSVPADRALAAALALEVDAVAWRDGVLLAVEGDGPGEVAGAGEPLGLAPLLGLGPLPAAVPDVGPWWREGAEVAAMVDEVRAGVGLGPLAWDDGLAEAALQHAAYLARHEPAPYTHRQDPDEPDFAGVHPSDRGGARELLLRLGGATPEQVVESWLTAPYHRMPLLHPGAGAIGVARVGRAWVAEIRVDPAVTATGGWPADGVAVPTGAFEGHEQPDPLPPATYPDVRWPVGFPVTVWGAPAKLRATLRCDGADVPFHVADAALGTPREAVHVIPRAPLAPGARCAWTAAWTAGEVAREAAGSFAVASGGARVALPPALEPALAEANERRAELGLAPLVPTADARARARLLSARTRAMTEGLPTDRVPGLTGGDPGDPRPAMVCTRPDEPLEVDEAWLSPEARAVGGDAEAVVVTRSRGPDGPRATLATPRVCAWIFGGG